MVKLSCAFGTSLCFSFYFYVFSERFAIGSRFFYFFSWCCGFDNLLYVLGFGVICFVPGKFLWFVFHTCLRYFFFVFYLSFFFHVFSVTVCLYVSVFRCGCVSFIGSFLDFAFVKFFLSSVV